jgi:hypothetical protein
MAASIWQRHLPATIFFRFATLAVSGWETN